jgi:integrase
MSTKFTLTDRFITSPRRVPKAGRVDFWDALVPGMALRVTSSGHRSFTLTKRYPLTPEHPTRRALGDYGAITLDQARQKARRWLELITKGIDPRLQEARDKAAEQTKAANTLAALWTSFYEHHAGQLAKADEAKRAGTAFIKLWGIRPAAEIEPAEIAAHIRTIAKRTPSEARNRLGHLRRMYSWAIGAGGHGIAYNPCAMLKPKDLVGEKLVRDRVLTDDELRAIWRATDGFVGIEALAAARARDPNRERPEALGYPYGPLVRLLLLTGQRVNEAAGMRWAEIDFDKALWTIPASRMKGGRAHVVPLAPDALALLGSMPRVTESDFVFTTTGRGPVNGLSAMKRRLDELSGVRDWVLHDLRRSMRTHLSALPVQDMVRELVIAHARPGLHKVYDLHSYEREKLECLTLWEHRLRGILSPKPAAAVADIAAARAERAAW